MARHHGLNELQGMEAYCHYTHAGGHGERFGRIFDLPPLYLPPTALAELGKQGGPMDGGAKNNRTSSVAVGQVFFGQFIDHDITLDTTSSLSRVARPEDVMNVRTPTLDLDSVYGLGPEATPFLYHASGDFAGVKLLAGADGTAADQPAELAAHDLARSSAGTAIIGDPRNDENRIISQLHLAMLRFHNNVAERLRSPSLRGKPLYEEARRLVTWHYQWVVIQDFLGTMCGRAVVSDILGNGRKFYRPENTSPFIPIEFAVAAFRFGHSMIPQKIQVQKGESALEVFGSTLGRGFSPLASPQAIVDFHEVVDTSLGRDVQRAEKLDSRLATDLLKLPFIPDNDIQSLATRNLLRGQTFLLPSGENIARALGRSPAEIQTVSDAARVLGGADVDLTSGTPLWLYLLIEAEKVGRETRAGHFDKGEGLGPVGARIVAETLIGLAELDSRSFLAENRNFNPAQGLGVSTLGEMLTFQP